MNGMEMMVKSLIKMLGLDPQIIQAHIEEIGKSIRMLALNSEVIRKQNSAIMSHLGIAEPLSETQTLTNGLNHDHTADAGTARPSYE